MEFFFRPILSLSLLLFGVSADATTKPMSKDSFLPDKLQLKTNTPSNSKSEGETETFTCVATCICNHPVPSVKLIRQEGISNKTLIQEHAHVVTFRRQMTRRDNQVKFYCRVAGTLNTTKYAMRSPMITYNVFYSPRIDPAANIKYEVAGEIGNEASFELAITANPFPVTSGYVWSKDGNIISLSSPDYEIISGPTFSMLIIKSIKSSDYTNYTCSVKTMRFQAKVFKFKLHKPGPPYSPSELEVVNSTAVAATLKWISEFNGGWEQMFYVQCKNHAETWEDASEVPQKGITDPGQKEVVYHKVMGLESNVSYVFRVRSKNFHPGPHTSNFSNKARVKTRDKPKIYLLSVSRTDIKVTVRWKKVTGKYTEIKIRYCQTSDDCANYTVPNPEDNIAVFYVDANKTYYYFMVVEDGGDVVYMSTGIQVYDKRNSMIIGFSFLGVLVGAVTVTIAVVIVAVVLWKRGLVRWRKTQGNTGQSAAANGHCQSGRPQESTQSRLDNDVVHDKESRYVPLGPIARDGEYLDFRQLSPKQLRPTWKLLTE